MEGRTNFRVKKMAVTEDIKKKTDVLGWINPFLKLVKEPMILESATMKREYGVAVNGEIPNKYTRIGTVRIEPPPPINPKKSPTKTAPK